MDGNGGAANGTPVIDKEACLVDYRIEGVTIVHILSDDEGILCPPGRNSPTKQQIRKTADGSIEVQNMGNHLCSRDEGIPGVLYRDWYGEASRD